MNADREKPKPSVLLIDDDEVFCLAMSKALRRRGFEVLVRHGGQPALDALKAAPASCVAVIDLKMPGMSGLELLKRSAGRAAATLMLTGHGGVPEAVEAMRAGAHTFLTKPVDADELTPFILQASQEGLREAPLSIIGESEATRGLRALVAQLAQVEEPVLLTGETGTGKEVVARALHAGGGRGSAPFIAVNMACLPRELIESELFGHVKGAFTGAHSDKVGLFKEAQRGVLFLDEVAELPLEHQAKLLRVIEQGEFRPVGALRQEQFHGRLITATHKDLHGEVRAGRFREDLFYRLQVIPLHIPPLRERLADISPILEAWAQRLELDHLKLSPEAQRRLMSHAWPGNVRELVNLLRRLSIFYPRGGEVSGELVERLLRHNPFSVSAGLSALARPQLTQERSGEGEPQEDRAQVVIGQDVSLEQLERAHIEALINKYTNVSQVARILEINRRTLQRKLKVWGLNSGED